MAEGKLSAVFNQGNMYDDLVRHCQKNSQLFEDPLFAATDSSLFFTRKPPRPFVWKRPSELVDNPQLFVGGASRFDIEQGMLGDCWFLAALAGLSLDPHLLEVVVPPRQNFNEGIIKFNFWQYGKWQTVVVDDRLPTYNGKLVFVHSKEKNEFWSALLEKAYAKICGSYESLKGGNVIEAMEDFTGGVSETINMRSDCPSDLFKLLQESYARDSQLGCSINAKPNEVEAKLDGGLIKGHAYTITGLRKVRIRDGDVSLIRIRNPWGKGEWTGAWSDKSPEWRQVSDRQKEELGLVYDEDGEFWMEMSDFQKHFDKVDICHLSAQVMTKTGNKKWQAVMEQGVWQRGASAGGCRNFPDTFHINPQFTLTLEEPDENDDEGEPRSTCLVALMQKNRRAQRKTGAQNLTIGFAIYKYEEDASVPLLKDFFLYNKSTARSPNFVNAREVTGRFSLPLGQYVIVPSTFKPNETGDFLLRIYTMKDSKTVAVDEQSRVMDVPKQPPPPQDDALLAKFRGFFNKVSGDDMEIDAWELQEILTSALKGECASVSLESCKSMIALTDEDYSGKLVFDEFVELWQNIMKWKRTFSTHDVDKSGSFSSYEMRSALRSLGFVVSNKIFSTLVLRYANKRGDVDLDSFIAVAIKLKFIFNSFASKGSRGSALFTLDDFMMLNIYS